MTARKDTRQRWAVVREIFEACHAPGSVVEYRAVRLEKPEWVCDDAPIWQVFDADGEYLDSLRIDAFRSARELQSYLDDMSEREAMGRVEKGGRRRQPTD